MGVCPELKEDLNCTQECSSDGDCADNLKCCRVGCATVCHLPNGNPWATSRARGGAQGGGGSARFREEARLGPLAVLGGWNQIARALPLSPLGTQRRL